MNLISFRAVECGKLYKIRDPFGAWDGLVALTTPTLKSRGYVILYRFDDQLFEEGFLTRTERREKIFEPLDKPPKF